MLATVWKISQPILILVSVIKKITSREKGGDVMDKLVKIPVGLMAGCKSHLKALLFVMYRQMLYAGLRLNIRF